MTFRLNFFVNRMRIQMASITMFIGLVASIGCLFCGQFLWALVSYLVACAVTRVVGRGVWPEISTHRIQHVRSARNFVLVTGANTGIGLATCEWLVELGATNVILAVRDVKKGQLAAIELERLAKSRSANGGPVTHVVACDLASLASVRSAAVAVRALVESVEGGTLDLVLNAGLSTPTQGGGTAEKLELHFGAMHVGHHLLTRELMPLLRATKLRRGNTDRDRARVVVLSSMNAQYIVGEPEFEKGLCVPADSFNMVEYYSRAKLANVLFARALAARYGDAVLATSCCPGGVASDVWRDQPIPRALFGTVLFCVLRSNRDGALTTLHCLLADDAVQGGYHADSKHYAATAALLRSDEEAERLWTLTEKTLKKHDC
jgi:NAD(P)-dependent dehydrogenase (short-subunit alcohol dehydrogenase family)